METTLNEIRELKLKFNDHEYKDTRVYLSLDRTELPAIEKIIEAELASINRTLENNQ